jgi:hypothetical protein
MGKEWILGTVFVAAGIAVGSTAGCGSSSAGADGGSSDATSSGDGTTASDAGKDSAPHDSAVADAPPMDAGAGCFATTGSGSAQTCAFNTCGVTGSTCSDGSTFGSCPSAGLYGCCVQTLVEDGGSLDGGPTCQKAICYYSSTADKMKYSNCEENMYEGLPYAWVSSSP